jgi:hypothetical protein
MSATGAEAADGDRDSGEAVRGGDSSTTRSTVPAAVFAAGLTPAGAGTCASADGAWVNGRNNRPRVALNLPGGVVGSPRTTSGRSSAAECPSASGPTARSARVAGAGAASGGVTVVTGAVTGVG